MLPKGLVESADFEAKGGPPNRGRRVERAGCRGRHGAPSGEGGWGSAPPGPSCAAPASRRSTTVGGLRRRACFPECPPAANELQRRHADCRWRRRRRARRKRPSAPERPAGAAAFGGQSARLPWHGGHGRRRRRRRGDGCRSRATWASGQAGHPERRCLSPRPWRPNEPGMDAAVSGVGRAGAGKSDGQARGRGRPRCRRRSGPARAATTCRPTAWDSRARRPASLRGSRARRDRRSRRYAERRVGGHGPDCGGSP